MKETDSNIPANGQIFVKSIMMPPWLETLEAENAGRVIPGDEAKIRFVVELAEQNVRHETGGHSPRQFSSAARTGWSPSASMLWSRRNSHGPIRDDGVCPCAKQTGQSFFEGLCAGEQL